MTRAAEPELAPQSHPQTRPEARPEGTPDPAGGGLSLWDRDPRPVVALDWGARQIHVTRDGASVTVYPNVEALIATLHEPHRLVAEATFESYDTARRASLVESLRAAGHELYVFRPLRTARRRKATGQDTKSHAIDACVIWELAVALPNHVYPIIVAPDTAWAQRRADVNRAYNAARATGGKKQLLASAVAVLGPLKEQSLTARLVLGAANQRQYAESLLAATYFVALHARNRDEFERLLGLSGSAYPSLLRSEVHHHHVRHLRNRNPELPDGQRLTTALRRELRRVYAVVKSSRPEPSDP